VGGNAGPLEIIQKAKPNGYGHDGQKKGKENLITGRKRSHTTQHTALLKRMKYEWHKSNKVRKSNQPDMSRAEPQSAQRKTKKAHLELKNSGIDGGHS
jgi:hypothetical protein